MNITINIADSFEFKRAGVVFRVDATSIPESIYADIVYHGFTQKIGDAASGAKDDANLATEKMTAVYESLQAGNWGRERAVSTGPVWMPYALAIVRGKLGPDNKAAYSAIPSDDQKARNAFLQGLFDGLSDEWRNTFTERAKAQLEAALAEKRANREIGESVEIGL